MAIRTINYTVKESGITPATQQFAGVQGEHNATALVFALDAGLLATIREKAGENKVVYRFDVHDGAGGVTPTDPLPLTDAAPVYLLENKISRIGGSIQVFLIITEIENEQTEMELYSFPALLRLKDKQDGPLNDGENYESLSTLSETAKQSAVKAADSAQASEDSATAAYRAQLQTEAARLALEGGAEVVFLGGNHAANIEIIAAVDSEMSEASHNPVQNKVVLERIKQTDQSVSDNAEAIGELQNATEEVALFLAMHPVGSLYWSGENVNPSATYGGEWELVDKEFASTSVSDNTSEKVLFSPNETNINFYAAYMYRGGHSVRLRIDVRSNVEFSDTSYEIGTLNLETIGVSGLSSSIISTLMASDASNGAVMVNISYNGNVEANDVVKTPTTYDGVTFYMNADITFSQNLMLDSACDKFCWKRLA